MTTQELPFDALSPTRHTDIEDSRSAVCWTVEERAWKQELPDLPDEVIALLATPVVVSASVWLSGHAAEPAQEPDEPPPVAVTLQFLAPAPPLRSTSRHRTAGWALPRHVVRIA